MSASSNAPHQLPAHLDFQPVPVSLAIALNDLCSTVNHWATKKGWNEDPLAGLELTPELRHRLETALKAEQHMLFVTEVAEGFEYLRAKVQPAMDDKVPELTGEEAELADVLIRIFHYCGKRGIDLGRAVRLKHAFNITRPYKHGKTC